MKIIRKAISFDDVMMVPKYSKILSRSSVDLSTSIAGLNLKIPIIAANMSSVCGAEMATAMSELGGLGIVHRMCSIDQQVKMLQDAKKLSSDIILGFSIGVGEDWRDRLDACASHADIACLDIAHGDCLKATNMINEYFMINPGYPIIIGQVSTSDAVRHLLSFVPKAYHHLVAFKCSIGGGSLCTTRIKTGFGVPTLESIMDIRKYFPDISIIGDGGIKNSGDIVKSLAGGANAVMLGNLLAGTDEAPGQIIRSKDGQLCKIYRGSASFGDKKIRGEQARNVEGEETLVPYKGCVKRVIDTLLDGVRSGFSYGGASNLAELQNHAEFIEISSAGFQESLPHGK